MLHEMLLGCSQIGDNHCLIDASCIFTSGGDDNAIFTSKIVFSRDLDQIVCNVQWTGGNKFGHHSTITGIGHK